MPRPRKIEENTPEIVETEIEKSPIEQLEAVAAAVNAAVNFEKILKEQLDTTSEDVVGNLKVVIANAYLAARKETTNLLFKEHDLIMSLLSEEE